MCCKECLIPCLPCLWVCGFEEGGVRAGSCASCIHSSIGDVEENTPFANAQSVGANNSSCCCKLLVLLFWMGIGGLVLYCFGITPAVMLAFLNSVGTTMLALLDFIWLAIQGVSEGSDRTTGNGTI